MRLSPLQLGQRKRRPGGVNSQCGQYLAGWDPGVHPVQPLTETAGNWFKVTLPRSDRRVGTELGFAECGVGAAC